MNKWCKKRKQSSKNQRNKGEDNGRTVEIDQPDTENGEFENNVDNEIETHKIHEGIILQVQKRNGPGRPKIIRTGEPK